MKKSISLLLVLSILLLCSCSDKSKQTDKKDDVLYKIETETLTDNSDKIEKEDEETVQVPDFHGKHIDEVYKMAEKLELEIKIEKEQVDETQPEGTVLKQNPLPYKETEKGSVVKVVIVTETETITVPDFYGKTLQEAQTLLTNSGLKRGKITYEKSKNVAYGLVLSQSLKAGSEVESDSVINLVISDGYEKEIVHEQSKELVYEYVDSSAGTIRIVESGIEIYNGIAEPGKGNFVLSVKGTGKKSYDIYIDDVYVDTVVVDFDL